MKYPTPFDNREDEGYSYDNYPNPQLEGYEPEPIYEQVETFNPRPSVRTYRLPKYDKKNVFSLPSVIGIFMFILSSCFMAVYEAVEDDDFSLQEKLLVGYLFLGGVAEVVLRGSEGATAVYSPKGLPGKSKDDYDNDGIPNDEDAHPYDPKKG